MITIAPGKTATAGLLLLASPWPLGERFLSARGAVARADEHSWTREGGLPAAESRRSMR